MAVQIAIHRDSGKVVFDSPPNVQQSDLVFWYNGDAEAHFPVPGCGALKVGPGKSTPAYQPFPDTTPLLPLTIDYSCAIHPAESGTFVVSADTAGSPTPGSAAIDPQNVAIAIDRGGRFATVDVAQGDTVHWVNGDAQEHWPVPNCTGLLVKPAQSSNAVQPATFNFPRSPYATGAAIAGPSPLPMALTYGCAIPGHEKESGTINIYDNLASVAPFETISATQPGLPVPLLTGGKSPYTIVQDPAHPEVTVVEQPPEGSSGGIAVVLNTTPASSGAITLQVNVTDALGKNFNEPVSITI